MFSINQGTNEVDSQSNPHPEAGLPTFGREDRHDMATGAQRERERERERKSVDGCDRNIDASRSRQSLRCSM